MKKKIKIFIVSYFLFLAIGVISCNDNCGGNYKNRYNITAINWEEIKVESINGDYLTYTLENEVNFNEYAISMLPLKNYYSAAIDFSVISKSYACSPVAPTTNDKITNIEVVTNNNFDTTHLEGSDISDFFNIVSYSPNFQESNITNFLDLNHNQLDSFMLVLKKAPLESGEMNFTVKITLDANELEYYEFTTNSITITND